MSILPYILVPLALLVVLWVLLRVLFGAYMKYSGGAVVVCPETQEAAGVEIDTTHAAWSSVSGIPGLRLKNCSRWPEREGCGQDCLRQIQDTPQNCMVRHLLAAWYAGKACVYCGHDLSHVDWTEHKPCVQLPNGKTAEWAAVPYERVPALLSSGRPVCWTCHITEGFRAANPQLVIERKR
jgi:hypothetical protein